MSDLKLSGTHTTPSLLSARKIRCVLDNQYAQWVVVVMGGVYTVQGGECDVRMCTHSTHETCVQRVDLERVCVHAGQANSYTHSPHIIDTRHPRAVFGQWAHHHHHSVNTRIGHACTLFE